MTSNAFGSAHHAKGHEDLDRRIEWPVVEGHELRLVERGGGTHGPALAAQLGLHRLPRNRLSGAAGLEPYGQ